MSASRRTVDYRVDPFDLHLFTAVVELGSITAAAQAVKLSLAAASARLQALEARAGLPLLLRSKSGAAPTDAGRALARQAQRVLAELESLHADLARFGGGLHGTLRLLGNTAAVAQALPAVLPAFLSAHPALDVDVLERSSEATVEALRQGRADLGIVASHVDVAGLVAHRWRDDRLVALVPAGSGLGLAGAVAFSTLLDGPLVGLPRDRGLSQFLEAQARRSGHVARHRVRLPDFSALAALVGAGLGVAVMPESAAHCHAGVAARLVPLADAWAQRHLVICMTAAGAAMPPVQALVAALRATP